MFTTENEIIRSSLKADIQAIRIRKKHVLNSFKGVIATLRTSGTEPKLKYYAEYCGRPEEKDWARIENELETLLEHLKEEFLQPKENCMT